MTKRNTSTKKSPEKSQRATRCNKTKLFNTESDSVASGLRAEISPVTIPGPAEPSHVSAAITSSTIDHQEDSQTQLCPKTS